MTTYAFPSLTRSAPSLVSWSLIANTAVFESPLSGAVQTLELPGARWAVSMSWPALGEPDAGALMAFLAQLRGRANRFTVHNFARPSPKGTAGGTPLVKGASQTGASLLTDGWTVGATLLAGDLFAVNGELKIVTTSATADGAGEMTIAFEPPLRSSPADNAALTVTRPTATFVLDDTRTVWVPQPSITGPLWNFELAATEAFS